MNWKDIIVKYGPFTLIVLVLCFSEFRSCQRAKKIEALTGDLENCLNAPIRVDTIHDSVYIVLTQPYRPVPVRVEPSIQHDTITKPCISWYDDVYRFEGGRIRWRAKVEGCMIDSMLFTDMVFPKDIIRITKTVDTCESKPPEYKPKNHLGMSIGLAGNTTARFPLVDADMWWSVKDKWAPYAGVQYDTYHNQVYLKAGVRIFFK